MLNPLPELNSDFYLDADFDEMYGHEKATDPACVKIITGYSVTVSNFPVRWRSTLQTKTALFNIEEEIISMSHR